MWCAPMVPRNCGGCVYNGLPIPGARIHVTGERIHLGGPMIAQGYRNSSDDEAFAYPMWFSTQDTGQMVDGRLQVTGRIDTVIDSGGLKLHPEVVESAMLGISGVKAACVVGVPHPRLGQAVVAVYVGPASPGQVIAGLSELPRWQLPKELKRLDACPSPAPARWIAAQCSACFSLRVRWRQPVRRCPHWCRPAVFAHRCPP